MDAFLIGDGSARLLEGYVEDDSYSKQISLEEDSIPIEDDISNKVHDITELTTRDEIDFVFYQYKKQAYDLFDFVKQKSTMLRGIPVKVEDLVLDDADKYLIDYLIGTVKDLYIWRQLAQLHAYSNMCISQVQFFSKHDCQLCKANLGSIFMSDLLLRSLCTGGNISHPGCDCELFPVVYRESYEGPLANLLEIELLTLADRDFLHVPVELYRSNRLDRFVDIPIPEVDFVNMPKWCSDNKIKDSSGLVVYSEEETLYVHNSYVGDKGPIEFLDMYFGSDIVPSRLTDFAGKDQYLLDGKLVVKHGGYYYDAETGMRK